MEKEEITGYLEYKVGDFALFLGNVNNPIGNFGVRCIARIDKFERFHLPNETKVRMLITLLDEKKQVRVDYHNLQELKVEDKHLHELGFKLNQNKSHLELDGIVLSSKNFTTGKFVMEQGSKNYISGWCIGDLNAIDGIRLKKYIVDGEFELKELYKDFPSVYNLNRLFDELERNHQKVDREKIARL